MLFHGMLLREKHNTNPVTSRTSSLGSSYSCRRARVQEITQTLKTPLVLGKVCMERE